MKLYRQMLAIMVEKKTLYSKHVVYNLDHVPYSSLTLNKAWPFLPRGHVALYLLA
jgi:hypothetical protein